MALEEELVGGRVKVGDAVTARLTKAVAGSNGLFVPQGALVKGRVRDFRRLTDVANAWQVAIEMNEVEWSGRIGVFLGEAVRLQPIAGLTVLLTTHRTEKVGSTIMNAITDKERPIDLPGAATFFLTGPRIIPKGFQMTWKTLRSR